MGDYCLTFYNADRREFTTIAEPQVGDVLTTRSKSDVKALVCERRGIIACLASGDRVSISGVRPSFRKAWELQPRAMEATFGHDSVKGHDCLFVENGRVIPIAQLNRKIHLTVLAVVPRTADDHNHEPAYSEATVRQMLDTVERCGELVVQ